MKRGDAQEPGEVIAARATVVLDARALDELGPATLDRLAELVERRLHERRAAGEAPLLSVAQAAEIAGVHPGTVRTAIKSGALEVAGYVGQRPRLRREDIDRWLGASGGPAESSGDSGGVVRLRRRARPPRRGALTAVFEEMATERSGS